MLKECGYSSYIKLFRKLSATDMERGLFDLVTEDELMVMCTLMAKEKYFEIFASTTRALSQEGNLLNTEKSSVSNKQTPVMNPNYRAYEFEFPHSTKAEIEEQKIFNEIFGLDKEFYEYGNRVEKCEQIDEEEGDESDEGQEDEVGEEVEVHDGDDNDDESIHDDESNKDESDDDLIFEMNVDISFVDKPDENDKKKQKMWRVMNLVYMLIVMRRGQL